MMRSRSCGYVSCSILAAAACAGAPRAPAAPPSSEERGMKAEIAPLALQLALHLRGSKDGPLGNGDTVVNGDRIKVSVQTSEDAHLYLAYCTSDRVLAVYPNYGSVRTRAGEVTTPPADLVLDTNTGPEALYVILSRSELSSADPKLAYALHASQQWDANIDCGGGDLFTGATAGSTAAPGAKPGSRPGAGATHGPAPARRPGEPPALANGPAGGALASRAEAGAPVARPGGSMAVVPDDAPPPLVTIERGMYMSQSGAAEVSVRADANGIAVLRYRFQHVAPPRQ